MTPVGNAAMPGGAIAQEADSPHRLAAFVDADAHLFRRYVVQHGFKLGAFARSRLDASVADKAWLVLCGGYRQTTGSGYQQADCNSTHVILSSQWISPEFPVWSPQGGVSIYQAAIPCVFRGAFPRIFRILSRKTCTGTCKNVFARRRFLQKVFQKRCRSQVESSGS